jgi:hypothetical protein
LQKPDGLVGIDIFRRDLEIQGQLVLERRNANDTYCSVANPATLPVVTIMFNC